MVWTEASREGPRQRPCLLGDTSSPDGVPEIAKRRNTRSDPWMGVKHGCRSPSLRGSRWAPHERRCPGVTIVGHHCLGRWGFVGWGQAASRMLFNNGGKLGLKRAPRTGSHSPGLASFLTCRCLGPAQVLQFCTAGRVEEEE